MQQCREPTKIPKTTQTVLVQGLGEANGQRSLRVRLGVGQRMKEVDVERQIKVNITFVPQTSTSGLISASVDIYTMQNDTVTFLFHALSSHRNLVGILKEDGNDEDVLDDVRAITTRTTTRSTMTFIVSIMCSLPDYFHILHISTRCELWYSFFTVV